MAADGEILEIDPGRRVLMTFHARWDADLEAEGAVRQAWEIEPAGEGLCKLSVLTDGMGPKTLKEFSGGIPYIASGLKTVLETDGALVAGAG